MRQRKIKPNNRSFTGKVFTERAPSGEAHFESSLERDAIFIFDAIPIVKTIQDQPITIPHITNKGNQGRYTPDLLVDFGDYGPPALIEVKYREDLFTDWPKLKPKFKAARKVCKERGWVFKLLTDKEIRTPYLQNVKFLKGFRENPSSTPHCEDDYQLEVSEFLFNIEFSTPKKLAEALYSCPSRQLEVIRAIWSMLAGSQIFADLQQPLNMNSRIWMTSRLYEQQYTKEDYRLVWSR